MEKIPYIYLAGNSRVGHQITPPATGYNCNGSPEIMTGPICRPEKNIKFHSFNAAFFVKPVEMIKRPQIYEKTIDTVMNGIQKPGQDPILNK